MRGVLSVKSSVLLLLLIASPSLADNAPVMVLDGDLSAVHESGVFTVIDPLHPEILQWWRARFGSPTLGFETLPADQKPLGTIAQAPIGPDGKFLLEIEVDEPRLVYFVVIDQGARDSGRPAFSPNTNRFILEPGELELRMIYSNYSIVTGGHYNDAVYGSWRLSDEYREAQAEYSRLLTPQVGETQEDDQERLIRRREVGGKLEMLEQAGTRQLWETQDNPLVQQLASDSVMAFTQEGLAVTRVLLELSREREESGEEIPDGGSAPNLPPAVILLDRGENEPEEEDQEPDKLPD